MTEWLTLTLANARKLLLLSLSRGKQDCSYAIASKAMDMKQKLARLLKNIYDKTGLLHGLRVILAAILKVLRTNSSRLMNLTVCMEDLVCTYDNFRSGLRNTLEEQGTSAGMVYEEDCVYFLSSWWIYPTGISLWM